MAAVSLTTCLFGLLALLLTCAGLLFVAFVLYLHYQHCKYAHIPAVPCKGWKGFFFGHSSLMMEYRERNLTLSDAIVDMIQQYGPVIHVFFFFAPLIFVVDPDFVKEILCTDTHPKPYAVYRIFIKIFGTRFLGSGLVSELNPEAHAQKRALLSPAFHRKYLQGLMGQFNAGADLLIEKLSPKADGKTEVVMLDELDRTTLDIIAKVAFGMDLNITLDDSSPFKEAVSMCFQGGDKESKNPWLVFSPLPAARKYRKEVRKCINFLRDTGRRCIEERLRAMEKQDDVPNDILTYILKEIDCFKGEKAIDQEGLIDEFVTLFIAGQETTANLLSFTLVELGHHPEVLHRLKTEVDAVVGDKDFLEYTDISKFKYMMQVLKETLRLWPPVAGTSRELACDLMVKGYKLPKGTVVLLSSYAMARMDEFFHDPLQFDPDRFNASDDRPQYAYFPFSLGSRNCIGQQFALIEARVLLAKLLHKFNFELVPGQGHSVLAEITMKPKGRCRNYITIRE
ncbi:cholesterol 24-hydroxylase-like [Acanthaster planci]|uniref:Cholesterol 24-hydroxylase n=1 Tax=Acanthaster planci TaxID=133434 RepID=A0A8B7Y610_ACAPL|nr:cholesterol 24-hydroxylase-like [Acanthaster planci]